jgi:hypothetical protein
VATVREAAAYYRISERAVQKRLNAGTLTGTKTGRTWDVDLTVPAPNVTQQVRKVANQSLSTGFALTELVRYQQRELMELSERIGYLESQLQQRDEQIKLLTAPSEQSIQPHLEPSISIPAAPAPSPELIRYRLPRRRPPNPA